MRPSPHLVTAILLRSVTLACMAGSAFWFLGIATGEMRAGDLSEGWSAVLAAALVWAYVAVLAPSWFGSADHGEAESEAADGGNPRPVDDEPAHRPAGAIPRGDDHDVQSNDGS